MLAPGRSGFRVRHGSVCRRLGALLALALMLPTCSWAAAQTTATATVTVTPPPIPLSDPEIVNPMRGFYRWYGTEGIPQPRPAYEHYVRYGWRALEPSKGHYDFSIIERDLLAAQSIGAKFAFRVMSINGFSSPVEVPEDLRQEVGGKYCSYNGQTVWVPNWDHPQFYARAQALMQALSARFNGDPWLAYYDMGIYGHWGEWHTAGLCTPPGTEATKRALVDIQLAAFADTRILMNVAGPEVDIVVYALSKSPQIGIRVDSLCDGWLDEQFRSAPQKLALIQDRWRTAPIVAEYVGGGRPSLAQLAECDRQVQEWHMAAVGAGNFGDWQSYSADEQAQLQLIGKHSGYRFQLNNLSYPAEVTIGQPFRVESQWSNLGVTPLYERFVVLFQIQRQADSTVIWSGTSRLDLERFLPTTQPQPVADTLVIPRSLPPGRYDLSLAIRAAKRYDTSLTLANTGKTNAGHYPLGEIVIQPSPYSVFVPRIGR